MDMLQSIGINATSLIQFALFVFTITFLSLFVFKPFAQAVETRSERTKGGEDLAQEFHKKTVELHSEYEVLAKEVHNNISDIYVKARAEAGAEYEKAVTAARAEATQKIEANRIKINSALATVAAELKQQSSSIAMLITQKLLGK